jgi:hypothetical protein
MASVRAMFDRARADHFGGAGVTQNVFGLGGTFNVTPAGKMLAQAYFADDLKLNGAPAPSCSKSATSTACPSAPC